MIRRIWHAYTGQHRADQFEELMRAEVLSAYEARDVRGFRGAQLLRRPVGDEVEFILNLDFDDADALKLIFADSRRIELPEEALSLLIRSDQFARDYDLCGGKVMDVERVPIETAAAAPAPQLAPGTWFVRSDKGQGSIPVTRDGHRVVMKFLLGMVAWGAIALVLALFGSAQGASWMLMAWPVMFAAGAALTAWLFIRNARKHTDYSVTYSEYLKARKNA